MPCALVLLPGLDGTPILFEPLLAKLELDAVPVSYPQVLPTDYADLLPFVLDALPTDREFVLLGWSFSGPLALMAAATNPPGLRGLRGVVLSASFVEKPLAWLPDAIRFFASPWLFHFSGLLARAKTRITGYGSRSLIALLARAHNAVPAAVMAARVRHILVVDARTELCACPVPILYLGAGSDWIVPKRNSAAIQRLRSDVQVKFIPGPHLAMAIHPAAAANELHAFVQSLDER